MLALFLILIPLHALSSALSFPPKYSRNLKEILESFLEVSDVHTTKAECMYFPLK